MGGTLSIRCATEADADALAHICLLTGNYGADATGLFGDDRALAEVFATPYLHGPGSFGLVWDEGDGPLGYVVGTSDTRAFQQWFSQTWWPSVPTREPRVEGDNWLLAAAADPERMLIAQLDDYPAHLHIDLLPAAQGKGAGRALVESASALLTERGVPGVHATAGTANEGARVWVFARLLTTVPRSPLPVASPTEPQHNPRADARAWQPHRPWGCAWSPWNLRAAQRTR